MIRKYPLKQTYLLQTAAAVFSFSLVFSKAI